MPDNEKSSVKPEMDFTKSHKERIVAFLDGRKSEDGTIKLNDFLKALWPISKEVVKPAFSNQGNMRKLRQDLGELIKEGKIILIDNAYDRLGDAHFPDKSGLTHYYDVTNLPIIAKIS